MATVDKEFADLLIKHNGWTDENDHDALDNPQCVRITKYQDMGGKDAYGAVFANERDLGRYRESEFVRNPVLYWEPTKAAPTDKASHFVSTPRSIADTQPYGSTVAWPFPTASAPDVSAPERDPVLVSGGGGDFGGGGASSSWSDSSGSSSDSSSSDSGSCGSSD